MNNLIILNEEEMLALDTCCYVSIQMVMRITEFDAKKD